MAAGARRNKSPCPLWTCAIIHPIPSLDIAMLDDTDLTGISWPPRWASGDYGDDRFGPYAKVRVGNEDQVMRWIKPGEFLMGASELDRLGPGNPGIRHRVHLTRGFWLGDTPCTQALWSMVMGENPSKFRDQVDSPLRPVEQVSWEMVQTFLGKLKRHLPAGCEASLPTEAQWEYAARAGSIHKYWWGDDVDASKANWEGTAGGTTAVKNYPSNRWGLYDMHGNVWEWCAGSPREYRGCDEIDPPDGQHEFLRVLRGGAWNRDASDARAAYRSSSFLGFFWNYYGFRLALTPATQRTAVLP